MYYLGTVWVVQCGFGYYEENQSCVWLPLLQQWEESQTKKALLWEQEDLVRIYFTVRSAL
jgi:hypothetical protein